MGRWAYLGFELRRLTRDRSTLAVLAVLFLIPFATWFGGMGLFSGGMLTLLALPVAVAWNWGRDLTEGALVPLALAGRSAGELLAIRAVVLGLPLLIWLGIVVAVGRLPSTTAALIAAFALHMLTLGFFLATAFRATEVGWLPIVFVLIGVFVPLLNEARPAEGGPHSAWVRWATSLMMPPAALNLGFRSIESLAAVSALAAVWWTILTAVLVVRSGVLDARRD